MVRLCENRGRCLLGRRVAGRFWEADSDLRCMINNLNYELTDTMADEGFYPERAIMNEEKYQQSGRTNGLFNGLMTEDVKISDDNPQ